jgi:hypothetical protein
LLKEICQKSTHSKNRSIRLTKSMVGEFSHGISGIRTFLYEKYQIQFAEAAARDRKAS